MKTLQIDHAKAVQMYQHGTPIVKETLENLFGADAFQTNAIPPDILKKFEQACEDQGIEPNQVLHAGDNLNLEQQVANAYTMLRVLAKAKRGTWEPDWTDSSQWKYYPWFRYKAGVGFVVDDTYCDHSVTGTAVGSRLCFPTREMAIEFGKENLELYRIILTN